MKYDYENEMLVSMENQNRNSGVYTQTLFGQSIRENPVPVWTADTEHAPFVILQDPKTGKMIGLSKEMLSCGLMILAEAGAGKTNLLDIITKRLFATQEKHDKLIIFDTKGDYFREFGDCIPEEERIVVGTGEEYRALTSIPNIFAEIMPRGADGKLMYTADSDTDAVEMAKQLFAKMQSEQQPIFPAMASQIVAGCLIYFMRTFWRENPERLNNKAFIQFMHSSSNEDWKAIFESESMRDYRSCVNYISGKGNQTQGVNSYIGSALRELFIGPFAKHDPEKEFSMREVVNFPGKKTVFIEYDLKRGEAMAPMYGLLIDRALANALGGRQNERNQVYVILDEMLLIPQLEHLSNALNFGRSQGVKILCGLQNFPALSDSYGEAGAKRILASFQNFVSFHNSDSETRQFIMERMGTNYQDISFSSQQKNFHVQREGHLVEDWDILSLKRGEAICSLKGEKPFLFTMQKYQEREDAYVFRK